MAALSDAPDAFGATLAETLAATDDEWRMRLAHRVHFVAVDDGGAVVGTIGVFPSDERAGCSQVVSMWVAPEARGRGVGDALLDAALQAANGGQVHLWVSEGNNHAERLYARHGFARTGAVQPVRAEDPDRLEFEMAKSA
jgi:GNAT superfamily N-acetyltransferase